MRLAALVLVGAHLSGGVGARARVASCVCPNVNKTADNQSFCLWPKWVARRRPGPLIWRRGSRPGAQWAGLIRWQRVRPVVRRHSFELCLRSDRPRRNLKHLRKSGPRRGRIQWAGVRTQTGADQQSTGEPEWPCKKCVSPRDTGPASGGGRRHGTTQLRPAAGSGPPRRQSACAPAGHRPQHAAQWRAQLTCTTGNLSSRNSYSTGRRDRPLGS